MPQFPYPDMALATSDPCHDHDPLESVPLSGVVGMSKRMLDVYGMVRRVAPTAATVLIQGETGTGKK
jgi:DNA-binding NtrC family response regulator